MFGDVKHEDEKKKLKDNEQKVEKINIVEVNEQKQVNNDDAFNTANRHLEDYIDVNEMKVTQLRAALKDRGLSTAGRKAELQARLFEHFEDTRKDKIEVKHVEQMGVDNNSEIAKGKDAKNAETEAEPEEYKKGVNVDSKLRMSIDVKEYNYSEKTIVKDTKNAESEEYKKGVIADSKSRMSIDVTEYDDSEKTIVKDAKNAETEEPKKGVIADSKSRMSIDVTEYQECLKVVTQPESTKSENTEVTQFFDSMDVDIPSNKNKSPMIDSQDSVKEKTNLKADSDKPSSAPDQFRDKDATKLSHGKYGITKLIKPITNILSPKRDVKNKTVSIPSLETKSSELELLSATKSSSSNGGKRSSAATIISASSSSTCSTIPQISEKKSSFVNASIDNETHNKKSSMSSNESCLSASSIRALAESKQKDKLAKQQARLEAMRGKARYEFESTSKANEVSKAPQKINGLLNNRPISSLLKGGNKENSKTTEGYSIAMTKNEQHKRLIAQMRERAQGKVLQANQSNVRLSSKVSNQQDTIKLKHNKNEKPQVQQLRAQETHHNSVQEPKKRQESLPRSPMDTYEMSDREGSESESDSDDEFAKKSNKRIPNWARSANLIPALEKQYSNGPERIDPDTIFPEVETCDLEKIFDRQKSRYVRRTSSGNWSDDRVTIQEKLVYKRQMGFNQR